MEKRVLKYIQKYNLIQPGERIMIAVSGGMDSVVLLDVLWRLRAELNITLHIAHLDHQFRGEESKQDAEFVQKLADQYQLPATITAKNVAECHRQTTGSAQDVARQIRYAFFEETAAAINAHKIATAHTANDQAETILMRLLRGTGLHGFAGIPPQRDRFIRPLLEITRAEIEAYLNKYQLAYRVDSSNQKLDYHRNQIRHHLIPLLEKTYNPQLISILQTFAQTARTDDQYLTQLAQQAVCECTQTKDEKIYVDLRYFLGYDKAIQRRIIRSVLEMNDVSFQSITFFHIESCIELAINPITGREQHLPRGMRVIRHAEHLVFAINPAENIKTLPLQLFVVPGKRQVMDYLIETQLFAKQQFFENYTQSYPLKAFFDWDEVCRRLSTSSPRLQIRTRSAGDRFQPLGMNQSKKLKAFLIDAKVPRRMRDEIPLILVENEILWVVGYTIAEWAKIQTNTQTILRIELKKKV